MKPPSQRQLRVGESIRHALVDILAREPIHDPELFDAMLTFPEVRLSPDLKHATCYVMQLGGDVEQSQKFAKALDKHKKYLRGLLAKRIEMKFVPELKFRVDNRFEYTLKIDALIGAPHVARDLETE